MQIAVVGLGATGSRVARQLHSSKVEHLWLHDADPQRLSQGLSEVRGVSVRSVPSDGDGADVVILATPARTHVALAGQALANGSHVVSLSDDLTDVRGLLGLGRSARAAGRTVAVGAGFAPGLSSLLARHAASTLDEVVEIAIAKAGTGGPACARQHHRAMKHDASDWIDGKWINRRGGSGRDLAWFPPPIGARDCYRGELSGPLLLQRRFPEANRIAARVAATRRDRLTSRLPMLRPPHLDGGPGAIRVEVRGRRQGGFETVVLAVMEHPSVAAGAVAALTALHVASGAVEPGAFGLAELEDPLDLLRPLHEQGIRAVSFDGLPSA